MSTSSPASVGVTMTDEGNQIVYPVALDTIMVKGTIDDGLVQHGPVRVEPDHPGIPGNRVQIKSPCSDVVVVDFNPATGVTTRAVCPVALEVVSGRGVFFPPHSAYDLYFERGVGDPLYFIAAGVEYKTLLAPFYGTVAYAKEAAIERFLKRFSGEAMKNWKNDTGVPFPYRRFPTRSRRSRGTRPPEAEEAL